MTKEPQESQDVPVPPRVAYWMEMLRMAGGARVFKSNGGEDAAFVQRAGDYFEGNLRRAIAEAMAGKQTDADFVRAVAEVIGGEGMEHSAKNAARLRLIADRIDQPDWIDVDARPLAAAPAAEATSHAE